MPVGEVESMARVVKPPRAMAWVLVLASTAAIVLMGALATALLFSSVGGWPAPPARFWPRFAAACLLTCVSLGIRAIRWIYLLRRAETRIPIRDAYIGYLAGFSLLFAPLLIGEIAVRAYVNRRRGAVPVLTTIVVNVWERLLDVVALVAILVVAGLEQGINRWLSIAGAVLVALLAFRPMRLLALRMMLVVLAPIATVFEAAGGHDYRRLTRDTTWWASLLTSVGAWLLPGFGLWILAGTWSGQLAVGLTDAQWDYARSATQSGALLAPGGVLVAGRALYDALASRGLNDASTLLIVFGVRLATVGVSTALGLVFLALHVRSTAAKSETHFDDIADAYDVQIPEGRRLALLERKTDLMKAVIETHHVGRKGLDVGCGQGAYVGRMRDLGFDVNGIDYSAGQIAIAARKLGDVEAVKVGSILALPAADQSYDFLYTINVLHHLGSIEEQRRAFAEMARVLKPGGLLFVHEINTRGLLFRFYMGYVFPSLNCIDEGIERWLLPHRLDAYTAMPVRDVYYFTFLPDFLPQVIANLLTPFERMLERSRARVYSAHYMAVLMKPAETP